MPSLLGILLLFGIIIKNAVLLIAFHQKYRAKGESPFESAKEAVRVRADVAIGGLLVGTLLTLFYVPMYAYIFGKK